MSEALKGAPDASLPRPAGIVTARISASTGLLAMPGTPNGIFELFRESDLATMGTDAGEGLAAGGLPAPAADESEIF
jgi:penicillin-binding protein 1A